MLKIESSHPAALQAKLDKTGNGNYRILIFSTSAKV